MFKVNNTDIRTMSTDRALVSVLLTMPKFYTTVFNFEFQYVLRMEHFKLDIPIS